MTINSEFNYTTKKISTDPTFTILKITSTNIETVSTKMSEFAVTSSTITSSITSIKTITSTLSSMTSSTSNHKMKNSTLRPSFHFGVNLLITTPLSLENSTNHFSVTPSTTTILANSDKITTSILKATTNIIHISTVPLKTTTSISVYNESLIITTSEIKHSIISRSTIKPSFRFGVSLALTTTSKNSSNIYNTISTEISTKIVSTTLKIASNVVTTVKPQNNSWSSTSSSLKVIYSTPSPLILNCGEDRIKIVSASFGNGNPRICKCNNTVDVSQSFSLCDETFLTIKIISKK